MINAMDRDQDLELPEPRVDGNVSLEASIRERRSVREFSRLVGNFTDDDENGEVQIVVTCPTLRTAGGTDAMRLFFDNTGGTVVGIEGFTIGCSGVDEAGVLQATLCEGRVTQL